VLPRALRPPVLGAGGHVQTRSVRWARGAAVHDVPQRASAGELESGVRVGVVRRRGEHVLPGPLPVERPGNLRAAASGRRARPRLWQVVFMELVDLRQMVEELLPTGDGRDAILDTPSSSWASCLTSPRVRTTGNWPGRLARTTPSRRPMSRPLDVPVQEDPGSGGSASSSPEDRSKSF